MLAFVGALAMVEVGAGLVVGQAWRLQGSGGLTATERDDLHTLFDRLSGLETAVVIGALATTLVWTLVAVHNAWHAAHAPRREAVLAIAGWAAGPLLFLAIRAGEADAGTARAVAVLLQGAALALPFWATGRLADSIGGQRMPFLRWYLALVASFLVHDLITAKIDLAPGAVYHDLGKGAFMLLLNAMVVGVMGVMAAEATRSMERAVTERSMQHKMLVEDAHQRRRARGGQSGEHAVLPSPTLPSADGPRLPAPAPGSVKVAAAPVLAAAPVAVLAPPTLPGAPSQPVAATPLVIPAPSAVAVLAPPVVTPPVVTPMIEATPVVTPTVEAPPVEAPPVVAPPVLAPPVVAAPVEAPPALAPPVAVAPVEAPPALAAPVVAATAPSSPTVAPATLAPPAPPAPATPPALPTLAASPFPSAAPAVAAEPELSLGDLVALTPDDTGELDRLIGHGPTVFVSVVEDDLPRPELPAQPAVPVVVVPTLPPNADTPAPAPVVDEEPSPIVHLVRQTPTPPVPTWSPNDNGIYPPLASLTAMRQVVESDRVAAAEAAARAEEEARLAAEAARAAEEEQARQGLPQLFAPLTPRQ